MKKIIICVMLSCICMVLCSCSAIQFGTEDYTMPELTESKSIADKEVENAITRMANAKHVPYELSDDFVSKYLDMEDLAELKARTIAGMEATNNTADLTTEEYQLWETVIKSEMLNQYTVSDFETKKTELYEIIQKLAEEQNLSFEEYVNNFNLSIEDVDSLIKKQAEKYVENEITEEPDEEILMKDNVEMDTNTFSDTKHHGEINEKFLNN